MMLVLETDFSPTFLDTGDFQQSWKLGSLKEILQKSADTDEDSNYSSSESPTE